MGGFAGIGHSSAKTDRGDELAGRQGLWSAFNFGLPAGEKAVTSATGGLDQAKDFWSKLLSAGRTESAEMSAPAVNAVQDQGDVLRKQEATMGTGRGGGTASADREASSQEAKTIDDIIAQNLSGGRAAGATGLAQTSTSEGALGANLFGQGTNAVANIMQDSRLSRPVSYEINKDTTGQIGKTLATLLTEWPEIAAGMGL